MYVSTSNIYYTLPNTLSHTDQAFLERRGLGGGGGGEVNFRTFLKKGRGNKQTS